eukprot:Pgem_evm1s4432
MFNQISNNAIFVTSVYLTTLAQTNAFTTGKQLPCGAMEDNAFCSSSKGDAYFCGYVNAVEPGRCPYTCSKPTAGASQWAGPSTNTVSFLNIKDKTDMLTIPSNPVEVINKMCGDDDEKIQKLKTILEDGRSVAAKQLNMKENFAQCFHKAGTVSVNWMHLHTFAKPIPAEAFPCLPGFNGCALSNGQYTCVASNDPNFVDTQAMAQKLLSQ